MSQEVISKYEELINAGRSLLPMGGFEHSGYNARLQTKYSEWRKNCLQLIELSGPIGFPYKQKILSTTNNELFYQSVVNLILNCLNELCEKVKTSPELIESSDIKITDLPVSANLSTEVAAEGVRVLKPPSKHSVIKKNVTTVSSNNVQNSKKVYVIGEADDLLYVQLLQFLHEIGLEEIQLERQHGQPIILDSIQIDNSVRYAFFIINEDDLAYAMFEIGHFVGKLGKDRVCVLYMSDVNFPKNVPGVLVKPIVIKLEEASLAILKDLKLAGYKIDL